MMDFFNYDDLSMNDKWKVTIYPFFDSHILCVDNVYRNPKKVYEYVSQCPIVSLKPNTKGSLNGKSFYDGQHYANLRFDNRREILFTKICQFYKIEMGENFDINPFAIFNQFKLLKNHPGHPYFWNPHVDHNLNVLIYLNPDENYSPGTSIYTSTTRGRAELSKDGDSDSEHTDPWKNPSYFQEELCILSRFNSLVAFPGQWPHGQTIVDNRYTKKTRITEVTFF